MSAGSAVEAAARPIQVLRARLVELAAERGGLEGQHTAAQQRLRTSDAERGPAVRRGDRAKLAELMAQQDAAAREAAEAAAALAALAEEHGAVTAQLQAAERDLLYVQRCQLAAEMLTHAETCDDALLAANEAFAAVARAGGAFGLSHFFANSTAMGTLLWGRAPWIASAVDASGRSGACTLTAIVRDTLRDFLPAPAAAPEV